MSVLKTWLLKSTGLSIQFLSHRRLSPHGLSAKLFLCVAAVAAALASKASAQVVGVGEYDFRSTADQAFAFDFNSTGKLDHLVTYRPGTGTILIQRKQNNAYSLVFRSFTGIGTYDLRSADDRIIAFDYTGSGKADHLLCYRPGVGTVFILRNTNGVFSPVFVSFTGIGRYDLRSTTDQILPFDYNGNGRYDHLVLYRPGTGTVFIERNTNGVFTEQVQSYSGIGGYDLRSANDRLIAFDYYGIGTADHLVAYRPGSGIAFILENADGSGNFIPVQSSYNGIGTFDLRSTSDRLLAYDYTRSGNQDRLLAYRPGQATAFVIQSALFEYTPAVQSRNGVGTFDLRSNTDRAFTFDYNSTGFLNGLAFYRPGAGSFFVETNQGGAFLDVTRN